MSDNHYLGKNRLLAALQPADFQRFFARLEPVTFAIRQCLVEAGQQSRDVYFPEMAVCSVLTLMSSGVTIEVGMIGNEGIVGVSELLGHEMSSQRVIAQIPGTALRMPVTECRRAFEESPHVRRIMLNFAGQLLSLAAQTAACNRLHSIEQRCARWLLMAQDRAQSEEMPMTHEFLASMIGVRRAGVTTMAQELQRSGLISYRQGSITIRDRDGLQELACECYRLDYDRYHSKF